MILALHFFRMFVVYRCAQSERTMRENTNAEEEQRKTAQAQEQAALAQEKAALAQEKAALAQEKAAQAQEKAALAQQKSSAAKIELENKRLQVRKDQNKAETEKHEQLQVNKRATIEFEHKQIRLTEEAKQKTHNAETAKLQQIRLMEEVKQKTHNAETTKLQALNKVLETFANMDPEVALAVAPSLGAVASVQSNKVSHPRRQLNQNMS